MEKRAVIVCYTFPPMPGVGGRRWVKYAKYLKRRGWEIRIISGSPAAGDHSPWDSDAKGLEVFQLPNKYPDILNRVPKNFLEKIWYRWQLIRVRAISKGNYYDRAFRWEKQLTGQLNTWKKEFRPGCVFVTGAPFSLLYFAALFRKENPDIPLLADIRDPWMDDRYFGFGSLSKRRINVEKTRLLTVLETADVISSPIENHWEQYGDYVAAKTLTLPHAVDEEDFGGVIRRETAYASRLVNFGSLYSGMEDMMEQLAETLSANPEFPELNFYSGEKKYEDIFRSKGVNGSRVRYLSPVAQKEVFRILADGSAALLFVLDHFKDNVTTKIMENVAVRVPIVAIGARGKVSDFIEENRLGIFIPHESLRDGLAQVPALLNQLDYNSSFDYSEFTFAKQAQKLEEIVLNLPKNT